MSTTLIQDNPATEGHRRRDHAFGVAEQHRQYLMRLAQRFIVEAVRQGLEVCADDVREILPPLPADRNHNFVGAAFGLLSRRSIITVVGTRPSSVASNHAHRNWLWVLKDRVAAEQWLADHPELPAPPAPGELFSRDELEVA